jgi:flagellar motility protein MotE (MotC chaperone)
MKGNKNIYPRWILPLFLMFCILAGHPSQSHGQDSIVFFDCGDIGVEARRILLNFNEEKLKLDKRQQALDKREKELKILHAEVDNKLKRLGELREELEKLLVQKDDAERDKVRKLSMIYQKRNPAAAAATLADMEKNLAVSILSMMRDKYAGKILDQMENETAVIYSTALGRLAE